MIKIFKKLYKYYHGICSFSMLLLTAGLEISAVLYILSFFILDIPFLGAPPPDTALQLTLAANTVMLFSLIFTPITDVIIKTDLKEQK